MRILLVNYTGDQPNPGCRATAGGLRNLLHAGGASYIDTLGLAYSPPAMSRPLSPDEEKGRLVSQRVWNRIRGSLSFRVVMKLGRLRSRYVFPFRHRRMPAWSKLQWPSSSFVTNLEVDRWISAVDDMRVQEHELCRRLEQADRVIVNGEGTLHHNQRTALTALAIARVAQLIGKDVHIVNTTVQAMHSEVLRLVLGEAGLVVVREPRSHRYLRGLNLECVLGADCAFAAVYDNDVTPYEIPRAVDREHACLVTGGAGVSRSSVMKITEALRRAGYSPFYFWIGDGDSLSLKRCNAAGIPVVSWDCIPWNALPAYLRQVKLVVSGRHHMIIFALMAGVPVIPLASNTWKIEGLCELFRWPLPVLSGTHGLLEALSSLPDAQADMAACFEQVARTSLELARLNISELSGG